MRSGLSTGATGGPRIHRTVEASGALSMGQTHPLPETAAPEWDTFPARLRAAGMRWTPQRRTLIEVLRAADGHVLAVDLIERCRQRDPTTTPSTVYRTLDFLEEMGFVRHHHGPDGREEYHVLPGADHGHLHCVGCGGSWEIRDEEAATIVATLERALGFEVDLSHVTICGRCGTCRR
jgi:Fe2+ or Zn2+ uptake regulation protein